MPSKKKPKKPTQPEQNNKEGTADGSVAKKRSRKADDAGRKRSRKGNETGASQAVNPEVDAKAAKAIVSEVGAKKKQKDPNTPAGLERPEHVAFWYEEPAAKPVPVDSSYVPDPQAVAAATARAQKLLKAIEEHFEKQQQESKSGDVKWLRTVLSKGTLSDRVAAMTLMVRESPLHRLSTLDQLLNMARKKGRREALMAMEALKDLFLTNLLPADRKLRYMSQQPVSGSVSDKQLVYWLLEDRLKRAYADLVAILEAGTHDTVPYVKRACLTAAFELLKEKPEAEAVLLAILVNKIGDPDRKITAKTLYLLSELTAAHPGMRQAVVAEIERLIFRPNVSERSQYSAVIWLNQIIFGPGDGPLAQKLISVYLALFKLCVDRMEKENREAATKAGKKGKKAAAGAKKPPGTINTKLLAALLTGVNRAFPFAKLDTSVYEEQLDVLYRIVHTTAFNTAVQALMLLYHVMNAQSESSARFYTALYEKLLSPDLHTSSKQAYFLNLLYRAMKNDLSTERVAAFAKRMLQVCMHSGPQFACGSLYLLSEVMKHQQGLRLLLTQPEPADDELERFVDVKDPEEEQQQDGENQEDAGEDEEKGEGDAASGAFKQGGQSSESKQSLPRYDPRKRNPLGAHATLSCFWELCALSQHYHPSVCKFAQIILDGDHIVYSGNPLRDFTNQAFLDRFVYKNPKSNVKKPGKKPLRSRHLSRADLATPVNTPDFLSLSEEQVPDDELFFHKYFTEKAKRDALKAQRKKTQAEADEELEEAADRIIEKEIDRLADIDDDGLAGSESDEEAYKHFDMGSDLEENDEEEAAALEGLDMDALDGPEVAAAVEAGTPEGIPADEEEEGEGVVPAGLEDEEEVGLAEEEEEEDDLEGLGLDDDDDEDDDDLDLAVPAAKIPSRLGGRAQKRAVFADSEEFAELLEDSANPEHPKLVEWQRKKLGKGTKRKAPTPSKKGGKGGSKRGRPAKRARR